MYDHVMCVWLWLAGFWFLVLVLFRSLRPLPLQDFIAAVAVAAGFRCGRCRAASYDFMSHV